MTSIEALNAAKANPGKVIARRKCWWNFMNEEQPDCYGYVCKEVSKCPGTFRDLWYWGLHGGDSDHHKIDVQDILHDDWETVELTT